MIEKWTANDLEDIYEIINDAALAYKGIIPTDCWHELIVNNNSIQVPETKKISTLTQVINFIKYTI